MIDMVEVEVVKETEAEGYVLVGKQATDGLNNDVPFGIFVEGEQVSNVEPKVTEEMEEVERCLKIEQEGMQFGYPEANESLREYMRRCHKRNSDMLLCPRCSIMMCRRVAEDYERWQRTKTERNWRKESQLLKVYPKPGESLLSFIVHCYKYGTKCLMCPKCGAVYNKELTEAFERIPSNQGWNGHGGNPNMYIFDKRGVPRRQDNPHPRAKRVMFKLPAEVPEDKWTQAGSKKGK
ncbi:hypothetical protein KIW84_041981 [Lathyrus oleraceus]|uniref:Uncharacterized protein n=1 Tax=Pisum sativum TaxID=3888 RepID=A0A9D5ASS6_PEA|nr:hypothetical protein KIW84_041981 [Pisum sativum]